MSNQSLKFHDNPFLFCLLKDTDTPTPRKDPMSKFPTVLFVHLFHLSWKFMKICWNRQISNISRNLVGTKIVDQSDVVGAVGGSPVDAAPTISSFLT